MCTVFCNFSRKTFFFEQLYIELKKMAQVKGIPDAWCVQKKIVIDIQPIQRDGCWFNTNIHSLTGLILIAVHFSQIRMHINLIDGFSIKNYYVPE